MQTDPLRNAQEALGPEIWGPRALGPLGPAAPRMALRAAPTVADKVAPTIKVAVLVPLAVAEATGIPLRVKVVP